MQIQIATAKNKCNYSLITVENDNTINCCSSRDKPDCNGSSGEINTRSPETETPDRLRQPPDLLTKTDTRSSKRDTKSPDRDKHQIA